MADQSTASAKSLYQNKIRAIRKIRGYSFFVTKKKKAYARAGVDVDLGNQLKKRIQSLVRQTHGPEVLAKIGGFGGLFRAQFSGMRDPVLVSSIDGVGTKLKIAFAVNRHDTVGADLVNHCVNDIAVVGARPLFFLDYIGCEKLEPRVFDQLLRGFSGACRSARCALIGGETAQMPGMYRPASTTSPAASSALSTGKESSTVNEFDPVTRSSGLNRMASTPTVTRSRAQILFNKMRLYPSSRPRELGRSIAEELLRIHRNYQPLLAKAPPGAIKGLAHITGGGLIDNLPRILPPRCDAVIDTKSWRVPPIFKILEKNGRVPRNEMYQVFNMGIGMVVIVGPRDTARVKTLLKAIPIGRVERGTGKTRLVF